LYTLTKHTSAHVRVKQLPDLATRTIRITMIMTTTGIIAAKSASTVDTADTFPQWSTLASPKIHTIGMITTFWTVNRRIKIYRKKYR